MRTRFVINVSGTPRTVFNVFQRNNGELNVHITSGGRAYSSPVLKNLVAIADDSAFEECEKHISVHTSPNSQNVNVIKRTLTFKDRKEEVLQVTTGIKRDNLFVPVFFRACGDQSRERYLLPAACPDNLVSLGQYDPARDQLRFMAVCSRRGTSFPKDEEHPSNLIQVEFSNFTLTVIWSCLNQPSHPQAIDFFVGTQRETGPMRGLEWFEIYNLYTEINMTHAQEYFAVAPSVN
jgi:hypothetical protein